MVVQGGTFYNDAVLRSFELISGRKAIRPNIAGLMGAFGAALIAKERYNGKKTKMLSIDNIINLEYHTKMVHCKGCSNSCRLTVNLFSNGAKHISGNRCEKGILVKDEKKEVPNMFEFKKKRLFNYEPLSNEQAYRGTIGIPRVLNVYENYPFWAVFFKQLGFRVELSPFSDRNIFQLGMDSIPSESECYPAKLSHGHIEWLIKNGVRTIFYPCVYYEHKERENAQNHFNCPIVISYPENIKNNVENLDKKNITFINPFIAFSNEEVLTHRLCTVMKEYFNIDKSEVEFAANSGWKELMQYRNDIRCEGKRVLEWIEENNSEGVVLAGRPYHLDPEVNHGIPEMIQSYGLAVLTEDSVADFSDRDIKLRVTNQWMYHARLYAAAEYVSRNENLNLIQLNSFGCGLDAVTVDQVQDLLKASNKLYTLLKVDEVNNLGAARIRVRSLIVALKLRKKMIKYTGTGIKNYLRTEYTKEMQKEKYTILCTEMSPFHFDFLEAAMQSCGYNVVVMKNENQNVLDMGTKYVNNDACYPAMIVTGQIMDAVLSGKYDTNRLAVFMTQTGGGCRASNYVGFIRKALKEAGFSNIPVISINANGMEKNSGFKYSVKMITKCMQGLVYGDILMKTLYRVRPYEIKKGSANELYEKWKSKCIEDILRPITDMKKFDKNCKEIIAEFDSLPINENIEKPKVAIVGEILVKFMPMANNHLADLLEEEEVEVIIPDLIGFLEYCVWNSVYKEKYLGGKKQASLVSQVGIYFLDKLRRNVFIALKNSKRFSTFSNLEQLKKSASEVLQLGNQCGEGWLLAGEIINFTKESVPNIVCTQPFGCLPNHIVGKGIFKKVKELYPESNLVAIDYDPSASEVNQINRIKLMIETAKLKNESNIRF